jgi:hypothetical protein
MFTEYLRVNAMERATVDGVDWSSSYGEPGSP